MHVKLLQANQERWQHEVLWGLPAPQYANEKGCIPHAFDQGCIEPNERG